MSRRLIGSKYNRDLYRKLFDGNIPIDINERIYIEPFGGTMGLCKILLEQYTPIEVIYNDLKVYDNNTILCDVDKIYHLDYTEIFKMYNTEKSFFYIDPPYIGKENYYEKTFEDGIEDHHNLFENITKLKGKWILSYHDNPILREWYKDYTFDTYKGTSINHMKEIIIKNY